MTNSVCNKKFYLGIFLFIVYLLPAYSQSAAKMRSALSVSGASLSFCVSGKSFLVQQSIGQSGAIGPFRNNRCQIRQGFIQPLENLKNKGEYEFYLQGKVYPNPFSGRFTLLFSEEISDNLYISLDDLSGRTVFKNTYEAAQKVEIDCSSLAAGVYILRVNSNKKCLTSKLLKE